MELSDWEDKNKKLIRRAVEFVVSRSPSVIHTFLPLQGKKEPDTLRIISAIKAKCPEIRFAFPRMMKDSALLKHFIQEDHENFITNQWGIAEPDPLISVEIQPSEIDLVLIPMLIFDVQGYRIGYGGGYYDRFLAECRKDVLKVGVSIFPPIERIEDINTYDIPLDFCITPDNIWEW